MNQIVQDAARLYVPAQRPVHGSQLDAILYINLATRPDRLQKMQQTLAYLQTFATHIERINAISHTNGGKGCALSHLKAFDRILESKWDTVLILEDDATLDMQPADLYRAIQALLQTPFDVVVCGSEIYDHAMDHTPGALYCALTDAQCTTAYLIRKQYVPVLRHVWAYCVDQLSNTMVQPEYKQYAIDQAWKRLFPLHSWWWICGNPFRQYANYSDIEHKHVDYARWTPRTLKEPLQVWNVQLE